MKIEQGTYWECRLCRCSWSGGIDIDEMRDHYLEDHPEADQRYLLEERDFMERKMCDYLKKKRKGH